MDARTVGLLVAVAGVVIVILGLVIATGVLNWFGRLPGDINVDRGNVRVFVPITSMLIVSVVLSVLLFLLRRWF